MQLPALLILVSSSAVVLAQFDDSDIGPLPPRVQIPGAIALPPPGGRPPFRRQRIQVPAGRPAPLPAQPGGVVRNRRPLPGRPLAPLPPEPSFSNNVISPSPSPSLPPPSPTPSIASFTQAFPVSLEPAPSTATPRSPPAVQESPDDDEYDLEDEIGQPQFQPSPRPVVTPVRPQNLPSPVFRPLRPAFKPTLAPPEEINLPSRQQARPSRPPPPPPSSTARPLPLEDELLVSRTPARPAFRPSPAPPQQVPVRQQAPQSYTRPTSGRPKKPVSQVINRYREDNPDGSITWGFENDDGTFKEETIGVDCTVRGKYGYIDPDGQRREYAYSSGIPCDKDRKNQEGGDGFIDYQDNKYILPNGDTLDLDAVVKNKSRRPAQNYRI